jgi:hypothetical protein
MQDHREKAIAVLSPLVELELAGAVFYTQYSLMMIFGHAHSEHALGCVSKPPERCCMRSWRSK